MSNLSDPLVVIARTHGHMVDPRFFQSYEELTKPRRWLPMMIDRLHVDRARNEIVETILHPEKPRPPQYPGGLPREYGEATHLLFLDDDMLFPKNGLIRLLSHDLPVVSGFYVGRNPPHLPVAYRKVDENQWIPITKFCAGLQEVDALGAGFLLIKTEVFKDWPRPWFEFSDKMGEDMYFCEEAKRRGFSIYLDFDVQCRHLASIPVGYEHFEAHALQGLSFQAFESADLKALSEEVRPYFPPVRGLYS